jgi:hypothetical protein
MIPGNLSTGSVFATNSISTSGILFPNSGFSMNITDTGYYNIRFNTAVECSFSNIRVKFSMVLNGVITDISSHVDLITSGSRTPVAMGGILFLPPLSTLTVGMSNASGLIELDLHSSSMSIVKL